MRLRCAPHAWDSLPGADIYGYRAAASLWPRAAQVLLLSQGSNGTFINGRRLPTNEWTAVPGGAMITFVLGSSEAVAEKYGGAVPSYRLRRVDDGGACSESGTPPMDIPLPDADGSTGDASSNHVGYRSLPCAGGDAAEEEDELGTPQLDMPALAAPPRPEQQPAGGGSGARHVTAARAQAGGSRSDAIDVDAHGSDEGGAREPDGGGASSCAGFWARKRSRGEIAAGLSAAQRVGKARAIDLTVSPANARVARTERGGGTGGGTSRSAGPAADIDSLCESSRYRPGETSARTASPWQTKGEASTWLTKRRGEDSGGASLLSKPAKRGGRGGRGGGD